MNSGDGSNLVTAAGPDHLAYVIYTSGTTGKPKGTLIEHRQVLHLMEGLRGQVYGAYDSGLRVSLLAPYYFDASVKQIFAALLGDMHCISSLKRQYQTVMPCQTIIAPTALT